MRGFVLKLSLSFLVVSSSYGQKTSFYGGISVIIPTEAGLVTNANNVLFQLLPEDGSGDPDIGISLGAAWKVNKRWQTDVSLSYMKFISAFGASDLDQSDPVLGPVLKVTAIGVPVVQPSWNLSRYLFEYKKFNVNLMGGLSWQFILTNRDFEITFRRPEEQRVGQLLSQSDEVMKRSIVYYNYGVLPLSCVHFQLFSLSVFFQRHLTNSITSSIQLEGNSFDVISERNLFQVQLHYSFLQF